MAREIVMQSNIRRGVGLLALFAAGLMGVAVVSNPYRAPVGTGAQIVDAIVGTAEAAATNLRAAASRLGGRVAPGQSRSIRQGNDSFRMHA
jgi:hypothetical protein